METVSMKMSTYETLWNEISGGSDQTTFFSKNATLEEKDFTEKFKSLGLDKIFTGGGLSTSLRGNWNCLHLYRDTHQATPTIVVYSDEDDTILGPLGEPGRDTNYFEGPDGAPRELIHPNRLSHLMIVPNRNGLFNELLPSTVEETERLKTKIDKMKEVVAMIHSNLSVTSFGEKVIKKAEAMGCDLNMPIQTFIAKQIVELSDEMRTGRPGYTLLNTDAQDFGKNMTLLLERLSTMFNPETYVPKMFIQGPDKNTQILTHIHCFMLEPTMLPPALKANYVNVEMILDCKLAKFDGSPLQRTPSNPPPVEEEVEDDEELRRTPSNPPPVDEGCPLQRATSVRAN
jgi:hypothetical protein